MQTGGRLWEILAPGWKYPHQLVPYYVAALTCIRACELNKTPAMFCKRDCKSGGGLGTARCMISVPPRSKPARFFRFLLFAADMAQRAAGAREFFVLGLGRTAPPSAMVSPGTNIPRYVSWRGEARHGSALLRLCRVRFVSGSFWFLWLGGVERKQLERDALCASYRRFLGNAFPFATWGELVQHMRFVLSAVLF